MARFDVSASRLNFTVAQKGKEYELRLIQRAQTIFSTLLGLLPSNYLSGVQGPNYTNELKAVAVELARIELSLEDVLLDVNFDYTRGEYLYSLVGYLCFLGDRLPTLDYSDVEFRKFLLSMISILFKGSVPSSVEAAVGLFLKSDFTIKENFLLTRSGAAGLDISDQFGFQIDVLVDGVFPPDLFESQDNIKLILSIIRPAHTLYHTRYIFKDNYDPEGTGKIKDAARWAMWSYYYDDFRSYWAGLSDKDRLGRKINISVAGENHSNDF